jgi:hypothetical protein
MSAYTSQLEDFEFDEPETANDAGRQMALSNARGGRAPAGSKENQGK